MSKSLLEAFVKLVDLSELLNLLNLLVFLEIVEPADLLSLLDLVNFSNLWNLSELLDFSGHMDLASFEPCGPFNIMRHCKKLQTKSHVQTLKR